MPRGVRTKVVYSGPFFDHDPAKRVAENIRGLTEFYSRQAADMIRAQFVPGKGSELRATIAERHVTLTGRTYFGRVYSTMTGPDPKNPNPHSWVTFAETGRRRTGDVKASGKRFKGFRHWAHVNSAIKRQVKEEKVRLAVMKGIV